MGPALDSLDGVSLTQLSLSTSKVLRKEQRGPFAWQLRHPLHLFIEAHDAVLAASDASSPVPALVLILERATKLLHITLVLLQSSNG